MASGGHQSTLRRKQQRQGEDHSWKQDAPVARLRWKNGDLWFEITRLGKQAMQPQPLVDLVCTVTGNPA